MLAGQVQGVGGFYDHTIALQAQGKSSEAVVSMLADPRRGRAVPQRPQGQDQVARPTSRASQLGITDTGSSTDFLTQYLAKKNGVDPSTTTRRGVGAGQTFIAAMKQKAIDCGMTTEPTVSQAARRRARRTSCSTCVPRRAPRRRSAGTYPATSLYMQTDWVNSNKDTVQKLVNAYVKTLTWIQSHTAAEIADKMPADYYKGVGKAAVRRGAQQREGHLQPDRPDARRRSQDLPRGAQEFNPKVQGKSIDLAKTYTNEFVKAATPVS